ncbi:uncharacterized protein LOC144141606 [Haemaphysalis longicornis]
MHRANSTGPLPALAAVGASGIQSSGFAKSFKEGIPDWSDHTVVAAACDVLKQSGGYPTDADRRALYKEWLTIYASERWHDSFDELMLLCIAFTPSPTSPTEPLFKDCFKAAADGSWDPVLDTVRVSQVFARRRQDLSELHASSVFYHFTAFLSDLLSSERSHDLNEAGMLIGFCSLLLCAASLHGPVGAVNVFSKWSMPAPSSIFRTSYIGRIMYPRPAFLTGLLRNAASDRRVLVPYAVVLPVAQFLLLKKQRADTLQRDLAFLDSSFLSHTRYGGLEIPNLLNQFSDATGLSMGSLNALMGGNDCNVTKGRVENYLRSARPGDVVQHSMPWCRVICPELFWELTLEHNIGYVLSIMCFLLLERPKTLERLRTMPAFAEITQAEFTRARLWAQNFEALLGKGLFRPENDGCPAGTSGS